MIIHNPILTGSFTVNGTDVASITSSAASLTSLNAYTASQNILNGTYTLTSSFAAQTASFTAFTSSVNSFTASQLVLNGTYATTGSNTFAGIQTVNSNLVVTGSITAQTLVVQTVTSSVVYSSGSNVFGNNIANTQVFTGSMNLTGSLTVVTTGTEFQVNANGVKIGNVIGDAHSITGSVGISGSLTSVGATFNADVTLSSAGTAFILLNNTTPTTGRQWRVSSSSNGNFFITQVGVADVLTIAPTTGAATFSGQIISGDSITLGASSIGGFWTWGSTISYLVAGAGKALNLNPNGASGTTGLSIATTGAATFSSTISAGVITGDSNSTGVPSIVAKVGSGGNSGTYGFGNSSAYRIRGGSDYGKLIFDAGFSDHMTLTSGGNLLIGHTTESSFKLDVRSSSGNNFVQSYTQITTNGQQCGFVANSLWSGAERGITLAMFKHGSITNPATYLSFFSGTSTFQYMHMDDSGVLRLSSSSGDIGTANGTIVGTQTSDIRLKNVKESFNYGLNEILQINPIAFTFKNDINNTDKLGFSAQEMLNIIPESVYDTNNCIDGYDDTDDSMVKIPKSNDNVYGMDYTTLIPVLVKAIQELQAQINELKNK